jgi:hypothetical protein
LGEEQHYTLNMKQLPFVTGAHLRCALLATLCFGVLAGCGKNDIRVYTIPKEKPSLAEAGPGAQPQIHWKLPAGWEERAGDQMRLARFAVAGKDGEAADISIIPLGGVAEHKEQLLNIWREQIRLPPATLEELTNSSSPVAVGTNNAELYELVSSEPVLENKKARMLIALYNAGDGLWIFKMSGHDDLVAREKAAFTSFLESISIDKSGGTPVPRFASTNARTIPSGQSDPPVKPNWTVPPGWREEPPSQMLLGKFSVEGDSGTKAEVTVSAFPGDVGGLLANINRWRGQVGLKDIGESDLSGNVTALDLPGNKATMIDVSGVNPKNGQKTRLIGAIIPREGKTWFFKLSGDEQVAEKQKPAFVKFIQTVQFPDA